MKALPLVAALAFALGSSALAQTQPPTKPPAASNTAADSKFQSADTNKNGTLEGAEVNAFKSAMAQADTNKDGKLSRSEFDAGVKAGHIK